MPALAWWWQKAWITTEAAREIQPALRQAQPVEIRDLSPSSKTHQVPPDEAILRLRLAWRDIILHASASPAAFNER